MARRGMRPSPPAWGAGRPGHPRFAREIAEYRQSLPSECSSWWLITPGDGAFTSRLAGARDETAGGGSVGHVATCPYHDQAAQAGKEDGRPDEKHRDAKIADANIADAKGAEIGRVGDPPLPTAGPAKSAPFADGAKSCNTRPSLKLRPASPRTQRRTFCHTRFSGR